MIPNWVLWPKEITDLPVPHEADTWEEYETRRRNLDRAWTRRRIKELLIIFAIVAPVVAIAMFVWVRISGVGVTW